MTSFLAHHTILLLFVILALGTALGKITIRGIAIGPAAVLFTALGFSAYHESLTLPPIVGTLGLAIFAYTIGLVAGPSFFGSLKSGAKPVAIVAATLTASGALAYVLGKSLGLSPGIVAGLYAGSHTNTPGLAAAIEHVSDPSEPTVAYSLTYTGGVLVMLAIAQWALAKRRSGDGKAAESEHITNLSIQVNHATGLTVQELSRTPHGSVVFSRRQAADDTGDLDICGPDTTLEIGDIVLAVGSQRALQYVVKVLGEAADQDLDDDRQVIDFRRVVLSEKSLYGRPISDLRLWSDFGVRATRVRRADHDFVAKAGFVVQAGDRIRLAGPRPQLAKAAKHLGDSEHGTSELNPVGLALGMALGLLLGTVPFVVPGIGVLTLGHAAGPLIAGLVLGRLQRSGPVVWGLPHQSADVLTQFGILLFLAFAGGRAGAAFITAVSSPLGWKLIAAGLVLTAFHGLVLLFLMLRFVRCSGEQFGGFVSGSQTQPAVLAFANAMTKNDERVALSYALVFPVAMVVKIAMCQVLTILG